MTGRYSMIDLRAMMPLLVSRKSLILTIVSTFLIISCQEKQVFNRRGQNRGGQNSVAQSTNITFSKNKLADLDESKLNWVVKYNSGSDQGEIDMTGDVGKIITNNIPAGNKEIMTVEFYEGETLKFVANRANTDLSSATANKIVIDDCLIMQGRWDGIRHNGGCNWTINDVL